MTTPKDLERLVLWMRGKVPFEVMSIETRMKVEEQDNILSGKTRIEKKSDKLHATITLFISKNLFKRKNIQQGIKCIMVHEFCHTINLKNPNSVMQKYFPTVWIIWDKAQRERALECSWEIVE